MRAVSAGMRAGMRAGGRAATRVRVSLPITTRCVRASRESSAAGLVLRVGRKSGMRTGRWGTGGGGEGHDHRQTGCLNPSWTGERARAHTHTQAHFFAKYADSAAAAVIESNVGETKKRAGSPSKDAEEQVRDEEQGGAEQRGPDCAVDAQDCAASKIN